MPFFPIEHQKRCRCIYLEIAPTPNKGKAFRVITLFSNVNVIFTIEYFINLHMIYKNKSINALKTFTKSMIANSTCQYVTKSVKNIK